MISNASTRASATAAGPERREPRGHEARTLDLSIVIVSYNTRDLLLECLASIRAQETSISHEVIVVDNHSSDGSAEAVAREFPEVRLLRSAKNVGFSVANNAAIDVATGRFVLLLNSDTFLVSDVLDRMVSLLRARPDVGIAGCRLMRPSGEMDLACRRSFPTPLVSLSRFLRLNRLFPKHRVCGRYNLTYLDERGTYEVDSIVGAFMLVRREVVDRLGALDEDYFMYGEDVDWCYRIKDRGWKVLYVGDCVTYHHKGASSRKESFRMNYHFHRAMWLFHRKHLRKRYPLPINAVVYLGIASRFLLLAGNHYVSVAGRAVRSLVKPGAGRRVARSDGLLCEGTLPEGSCEP